MARLTKITRYKQANQLEIPFIPDLAAGFPSYIGDSAELKLDLNDALIDPGSTTYYAKVQGDSMVKAGIADGDLVIVDRGLKLQDHVIAVCFVDGEYMLMRVRMEKDCCWLLPENDELEPVRVDHENEFLVWGIVTYAIKPFVRFVPW